VEPRLSPSGTVPEVPPATILVIEDDESVRMIVRRLLEGDGYLVREAEDGQIGLDLIEMHPGHLDLVLTDIDMPRIDGITVTEVLAALRPLLGVICMSGGLGELRILERLGLRPESFLPKPFTPETLARVVGDELARSQELAARAEAHQAVTRGYEVEQKLVAAVDLVAAAYRLQRHRALHGSSGRREGLPAGDNGALLA
jgi:CheY-like chemotaxis protein